MTATQDRPTRDDATQDQPADAYDGYAEYLDSLPESPPTPEDDAELCDHDEAARVAAFLERHQLTADFF